MWWILNEVQRSPRTSEFGTYTDHREAGLMGSTVAFCVACMYLRVVTITSGFL